MTTRGRRAMATGLALTLIAASAGVSSSGGFALLLSFAGVLTGASLIFAGVAGWLAAGVRCLRTNLALLGLLLASCAVTATPVGCETAPVLCLYAFALLLVGLSLLYIGVLLLGEQEQELERE